MRFLFRSRWGESLPLVRRVIAEGHDAALSICDRVATQVGDGLVPKCEYTKAEIDRADVVIFDCNDKTLPAEAAALMARGKPVMGTSPFAFRLEKDRPFAAEFATRAGLHVPLWEGFKGARAFLEAGEWMQAQRRALRAGVVFKANKSGVGTQVAEDPQQMKRLFEYFDGCFQQLGHTPDFILQQVIEGVEVSVEAWWNGSSFSVPNSTFEDNKLMNGDIGEKIGSAGETVWMHPSLETRVIELVILPHAAHLSAARAGRFAFDVNTIIDPLGTPWWLEYTPRFGYGAIMALMELVPDFADLLAATARGQAFDGDVNRSDFATGIGVHVPPFPIEPKDPHLAEDLPITGFEPEDVDGVYPMEVKLDRRGRPVTSGPTGAVCECVGVGATIAESIRSAYAIVESLHVPKMRYRTDIGERARRDYPVLERHHLLDAGGAQRRASAHR